MADTSRREFLKRTAAAIVIPGTGLLRADALAEELGSGTFEGVRFVQYEPPSNWHGTSIDYIWMDDAPSAYLPGLDLFETWPLRINWPDVCDWGTEITAAMEESHG